MVLDLRTFSRLDQGRLQTVDVVETIDALCAGKQLPVTLLSRLGSVSWCPDEYASFNFRPEREAGDWAHIEVAYRKSMLPRIAQEAGASPLPDKPWQPAKHLAAHEA